jgi:Raf kinase inhibitor-like YbhB/YbcL family protein
MERVTLGIILMFFTAIMAGVMGCAAAEKPTDLSKGGEEVTMQITSTAFEHGDMIPAEYTADGADVSPALTWGKVPAASKSLALICDDPDAPAGTWVHWVVWNLPPTSSGLPKAVPHGDTIDGGGLQGKNGSGKLGYSGPAPPSGTHRYFFKLYALETVLDLPAGSSKADLLKAMEGHVIGSGELMGRYSRNK